MKYEFAMRCRFGFRDLIKFKYQTTLCHSLRIHSPPEVLRTHCLGAVVSHMWGCVIHNYKHVVITVLFVLCFSDSRGFSWSAGVKTKGTEIKFRCCCFFHFIYTDVSAVLLQQRCLNFVASTVMSQFHCFNSDVSAVLQQHTFYMAATASSLQ